MVRDEMKGGVHLQELVDALGLAVLNRGEDYDTALVGIMDVNRPACSWWAITTTSTPAAPGHRHGGEQDAGGHGPGEAAGEFSAVFLL